MTFCGLMITFETFLTKIRSTICQYSYFDIQTVTVFYGQNSSLAPVMMPNIRFSISNSPFKMHDFEYQNSFDFRCSEFYCFSCYNMVKNHLLKHDLSIKIQFQYSIFRPPLLSCYYGQRPILKPSSYWSLFKFIISDQTLIKMK